MYNGFVVFSGSVASPQCPRMSETLFQKVVVFLIGKKHVLIIFYVFCVIVGPQLSSQGHPKNVSVGPLTLFHHCFDTGSIKRSNLVRNGAQMETILCQMVVNGLELYMKLGLNCQMVTQYHSIVFNFVYLSVLIFAVKSAWKCKHPRSNASRLGGTGHKAFPILSLTLHFRIFRRQPTGLTYPTCPISPEIQDCSSSACLPHLPH